MKRCVLFVVLALLAALLGAPVAGAAVPAGRLWITDDVLGTVSLVTTDGVLIRSFPLAGGPTVTQPDSGVAIHPDGTLRLAGERSSAKLGGIATWTTAGVATGSEIPESTYGGFSTEGVTVQPDGTFWVVDDPEDEPGSNGQAARAYHLATDGTVLSSFFTPIFGLTTRRSPQEIAYDASDGTLWIADNIANRIFHVHTNGTVINIQPQNTTGINPVNTFDPSLNAGRLQGVSVDPDGTLWVTARPSPSDPSRVSKIYNITKSGALIRSFDSFTTYGGVNPTGIAFTAAVPDIAVAPPAVDFGAVGEGVSVNQPVTISNPGTDPLQVSSLALTGSADFSVTAPAGPFLVPIGGSAQVSITYSPSGFDADTGTLVITSDDPDEGTVSVALSGRTNPISLGAASGLELLGLEGVKLSFSNSRSGVVGDAGLGPRGVQNFADGFITGTFFVDPTANNTKSNEVVIGGGTVVTDLAAAVADARAAAAAAARLPNPQALGSVKATTTTTVGGGLTVLAVKDVDLGSGKTWTINGGADSYVVVNVSGKFKFSGGGAIRLAGGLSPNRVLFNVVGTGEDVALSGGSTVAGLILAPGRKAALTGGSVVTGALIAGRDQIALTGGSQVRTP